MQTIEAHIQQVQLGNGGSFPTSDYSNGNGAMPRQDSGGFQPSAPAGGVDSAKDLFAQLAAVRGALGVS